MMKINKKSSFQLLSLVALWLTTGCGGGSDVIRTEINGQVYEAKIQQVNCFIGTAIDVELISPLTCNITFNSQSFYGDLLHITVSDVKPIYDFGIGQWLPVRSGAISAMVTHQGQQQDVTGGLIRFNRISNVRGDQICADVELLLNQFGQVDGNFCGALQSGF